MDKPNRQIKILFHDKEKNEISTENEIAATYDTTEQMPSGIQFASNKSKGDQAEHLRKLLKNHSNRSKKFPVIPKQFLFPIALALFIGISLGIVILKMFTSVDQTNAMPVNGSDTPAVVSNEEEADVLPTLTPVTAELPSLSVSIIQKGVFSTKEKADEVILEMQQLGYSATALQEKDLFYVFIALTATKDEAEILSSTFQDGGEEAPYVKNMEMQGGSYSDVDSNKVALIENAAKEFPKLVALTSEALVFGTYDEANWQEVKNMIVSLEDISNTINTYSDDEKSLVTSIINAGISFNEYSETGLNKHLWVSEQHLLHALTLYQTVFE